MASVRKEAKSMKLFERKLVNEALKHSFVKLHPKYMVKNPVMFTVEIGTLVMLLVCIWILAGNQNQGGFAYNFIIFTVLLLTLLFANFAEAIAEARGKAQAESLRKTREETPAKLIRTEAEHRNHEVKIISSALQIGRASCRER